MACGVGHGKEQIHRRKILLPSRCVCGGLMIRLFQVRLGSQKVPEDTRPCLVKGLVAVAGCS